MTTIISTNPGKNYQKIGEVEESSEAEIKKKIQKAQKAKKGWKDLGVEGRVKLLRPIISEIKRREQEITSLITQEMGMSSKESKSEVPDSVDKWNWYLDNAAKFLAPEISFENGKMLHKVFYEPIGVAAVIVPWNFPLSNFTWGVAQNLIAGNTVIFKASEETLLCGKLIEEIMQSSNLPEGVFSEVYGDGEVGDFLVHQDVDLIWFTGSSKTGRHIYKMAAENFCKVLLELGGSAPGIVFEDADVDRILDSVFSYRFYSNGQVCDGLKRLIVHENKLAEVVEKLTKLIKTKTVGDPEEKDIDFGSLVAKRQVDLLKGQVQDALDKGAKVEVGGKEPEGLEGAYYEPTLLTGVTKDMRVWQEEVFGPVLPIMSFKTEEEAIKIANDTKYGLGSYLFTEDKEKSLRVADKIEAGMVGINNAYYLNPASPFGGYKKSGLGRTHGKYGLRELSQVKVVAIEK